MLKPTVLSPAELDLVLRLVNATNREYGAARICRVLAPKHSVRTRTVNVDASVGNISDFTTKAINPRIKSTGLMVGCTKPLIPFKNKHDQSTGECLWSWYRDAANEPDYESLDADLDDLADQYPDLLAVGPGDEQAVNAWVDDLAGAEK